jgi:hypothetical protein
MMAGEGLFKTVWNEKILIFTQKRTKKKQPELQAAFCN